MNSTDDSSQAPPAFDESWHPDTLAIRAFEPFPASKEHSAAIQATSSFCFDSAAQAAAVFAGDQPGFVYSRFSNPTVRAFERRLAAMEGGEAGVGAASGMSAILAVCLSQLRAGDHLLASRTLFGSTISLFNNVLNRFAVDVSYVNPCDIDAWKRGLKPNTRLLFVETPTNPLTEVIDIASLADVAHGAGARLVVDNCFLTPILQKPLALGADIVVHSATKYLDGQGRCVGGAVIGNAECVGKEVFGFLRTAGPSMSPFNAWVFLKGLETLGLRMRAHCDGAQKIAEWLQDQPGVTRVFYPGLEDHPQHRLAERQQSGYGGIVSFEVRGGRDAAWAVIDRCRLFSITANLGDTRSTITHPASTTHGRIPAEVREAGGIHDSLVRLSVGLEHTDDLIGDLARGLPV